MALIAAAKLVDEKLKLCVAASLTKSLIDSSLALLDTSSASVFALAWTPVNSLFALTREARFCADSWFIALNV